MLDINQRPVRNNFYRSKTWRNMAYYIWLKQKCLCSRCGRVVYVNGISSKDVPKEKRLKGIVHHKIYLTNENYLDPTISLNEDLLEGLCIDCHNNEHFKGDGAVRYDLEFDEFGNLKERYTPRT